MLYLVPVLIGRRLRLAMLNPITWALIPFFRRKRFELPGRRLESDALPDLLGI